MNMHPTTQLQRPLPLRPYLSSTAGFGVAQLARLPCRPARGGDHLDSANSAPHGDPGDFSTSLPLLASFPQTAPTPQRPTSPHVSLQSRASTFISSNFLPLALTTALAVGVLRPELGAAAAKTELSRYVVIAIFILAGLQLKRGEAGLAVKSSGSVAYGLASILLLGPLLAPLVLALPLQPPALSLGLAVFLSMPTALSSGIAMTATLGGSVAMAILLTVSSNLLAVATLPLLLPLALGPALAAGGATGLALDSLSLLKQLVQMVLLPTLVGALARAYVPGVAAAVDGSRQLISYVSALCLAMVPWMQVSRAVIGGAAGVSLPHLAAAAVCGVLMHVGLLIMNLAGVKLLRLGGAANATQALKIQQAVVLQASQKTLPVAITVLSSLAPWLGPSVGLACIAAVLAHLSQILVDSLLVSWWLGAYGRIGEGRPLKLA